MSRGRPAEIAIIGLGCRFAGALRREHVLREHPRRPRTARAKSPPIAGTRQRSATRDSPASDRVPTCRGGYLDSPIAFDAAEHGIMPRTVAGGEPEQFLVLEAATAALADAGLAPRRPRRTAASRS